MPTPRPTTRQASEATMASQSLVVRSRNDWRGGAGYHCGIGWVGPVAPYGPGGGPCGAAPCAYPEGGAEGIGPGGGVGGGSAGPLLCSVMPQGCTEILWSTYET